MSKAKALRKLKLRKDNLVTAKETIILYPRVLIYSTDDPDTIGYLSCIGSNQREFDAFFNNNHKSIRMAVGQKVVRGTGDYQDTIEFESLVDLSKRFKHADPTISNPVDSSAKYVIVFFWNPETIDRDIIHNYKYYLKYISNNPSKKIQLLAILNE